MASKQAKIQFVMPKLPSDLIVTRHKNKKQMKLTKQDKITKSITPKKCGTDTIKKNKKKVAKKEVLDKELAGDKEYYPNKLKRNMTAKKIVLKPKYNLKVVAVTNKRKRGTPKKDMSSMEYPVLTAGPCDQELSMCDAVRLADETQSLTDEDWMEILTCPSPVWWEDPPYAVHLEDAILRLPDEKIIKDSQSHTQTSSDSRIDSQPHTETSNDSHSHTQTSSDSRIDSHTHTHTSPDGYIDFEQEISKFKIKTDKFSQKKKKLEHLLDNIIYKNNKDGKRRFSESTEGEDIFSDLSLNEEDILQHLENIDIPIERSKSEENIAGVDEKPPKIKMEYSRNGQNESVGLNSNGCGETSSHDQNKNIHLEYRLKDEIDEKHMDEKTIKMDEKSIDKNIVKPSSIERRSRAAKKMILSIKGCKNKQNFKVAAKNSLLRNANNTKRVVPKKACIDSEDQIIGKVDDDRNSKLTRFIKVRSDLIKNEFKLDIPNQMPPLKRRPVLSNDIKNMDISIDSISDANIRFISDEDSIDEMCINKTDLEHDINEITSNNDFPKKLINDLTECITVYRIMSNDDKKQVDNDKTEITKRNDNATVTGKLNDFFKKCKSNNKRLKKENTVVGEIKKEENSDVNNVDEVNRLNGCDYCIVKTEQGATDFSCDNCNMSPIFSCDLCNFRSNAKDVIINHVTSCNKYNRTVVMC